MRKILEWFIGIIVFILVFIVGFLYTFFKHVYKLDYSVSKHFEPITRSVLLATDGLANAGGGEMINDYYKVEGIIRFGNWRQTISEVNGLLFKFGKEIRLRNDLDKVLGENHCIDSITEQNDFYYKHH